MNRGCLTITFLLALLPGMLWSEIIIDTAVGFNGAFLPGQHVPVWIFVQTTSESIRAELSVQQDRSTLIRETGDLIYTAECILQRDETKRYFFSMPIKDRYTPLSVRLTENDAVLYEQTVELPPQAESAPFLLDLTSTGRVPRTVSVQEPHGGNTTVQVYSSSSELLPQLWSAYGSVAGVITDSAYYAALQPRQQRALFHFVAAGGKLVFQPGPPVRHPLEPDDPLLPKGTQLQLTSRPVGLGKVYISEANHTALPDEFFSDPAATARPAAASLAIEDLEHGIMASLRTQPEFTLPLLGRLISVWAAALVCIGGGLLYTCLPRGRSPVLPAAALLVGLTIFAAGGELLFTRRIRGTPLYLIESQVLRTSGNGFGTLHSRAYVLSPASATVHSQIGESDCFIAVAGNPSFNIHRPSNRAEILIEPWRSTKIAVDSVVPVSFSLEIRNKSVQQYGANPVPLSNMVLIGPQTKIPLTLLAPKTETPPPESRYFRRWYSHIEKELLTQAGQNNSHYLLARIQSHTSALQVIPEAVRAHIYTLLIYEVNSYAGID